MVAKDSFKYGLMRHRSAGALVNLPIASARPSVPGKACRLQKKRNRKRKTPHWKYISEDKTMSGFMLLASPINVLVKSPELNL